MANPEHLEILKQGVKVWNEWRKSDLDYVPDLSGADLRRLSLKKVNLYKANLDGVILNYVDLVGATLTFANLRKAELRGANLTSADLNYVDLSEAHLENSYLIGANILDATLVQAHLSAANLTGAHFHNSDLTGADLRNADLTRATLVETKLIKADLTGCHIYGTSAWDVNLEGAKQSDLVITRLPEPAVTVDNLAVAQFIYLLLNNEKMRDVIDTITAKAVLILGRFSPARKSVLDAVREELRQRNYLPILFDFKKPASKDQTGAVEILARMARFIIVDLTDPSSVPHELATVVPFLRTTPIRSLRLSSATGYTMFDDLRAYPWVLATYHYEDGDSLVNALAEVIAPAEELAGRLQGR